jgi:ribonuclease E
MKRMLINATQAEELRVAIVDGQQLYDIDIEQPAKEQKKSNIYKGRIVRLEPSLEAAFVDYGGPRHGFLPLKEISRDYFVPGVDSNKASMKEYLREGQEVVVQVDKEERGNKGAALTTYISLAGRYMVLMPNSPTAGGVSRRIEGDDRQALKQAMDSMTIPEDMGVIIRTAGMGRDAEELQWDLNYLVQLWSAISEAALSKPSPSFIHQESRLIIRALRDYMRPDIGEVLVDTDEIFQQAQDFMQWVMPHNLRKLKMYSDDIPLFNRFQIESQIEQAYERTVRLPSGGSIVVDQTEALTAVDVNSSRATKGGDIEETALNTNLEAAEEVARQMRLRDLGGLVVIDFIDMSSGKHQRMVEDRLQQSLKLDRARVQIGKISRFGLLEMSRQRLRPSLGESSQIICPRCDGHGRMRSVESLSLSILRLAEEQAMKDKTAQVLVQAPPQIANYLLNEKRRALVEIETRHEAPIIIISDEALETPHFNVTRIREGDQPEDTAKPSYQRGVPRRLEVHALTKAQLNIPAEPAVTHIKPSNVAPPRQVIAPEPVIAEPTKPGFIARFFGYFASDKADSEKTTQVSPARNQPNNDNRRERPDNRGNNPRQNGQNKGKPKGNRGDRPERPERSEEERKQHDEQRRLEQQKRREEQQKRDLERREAQRAESLRREAERKAQRDAEAAKAPAAVAVDGEDSAAETLETGTVSIALESNANNSPELAADGTPRRRRGRRGGRRRRRNEGDSNESSAGQDQSEMEFEDADDGEDIIIQTGAASTETAGAALVRSAAIAAAVPVSNAESDFSDLPRSEPASPMPVTASPSDEAKPEAAPLAVAVAVAPTAAPVAQTEPAVVAIESTATPVAEAVLSAPEVQAEPVVRIAETNATSVSEGAAPVVSEYIEPKPQQTGYVPVAPPSFSMPSAPSNAFDFTVRISPENKAD